MTQFQRSPNLGRPNDPTPFQIDPDIRTASTPPSALDRLDLEDEGIVEQVQQGVESRLYDRGRYSPSGEGGTHHFHRLLAAFMFEDEPKPPRR